MNIEQQCPFCAAGDDELELARIGSGPLFVICRRCGCQGPPAPEKGAAMKLWNTRDRVQSGG